MKHSSTAIILAAGRGSRLKELSLAQPKPMTEVNKTSIISNLIRQLINLKVRHIVIVIGYLGSKLAEHILDKFSGQAEFVFVENPIFDKTNNIYSLYLAREYMAHGFFLLEADVYCDFEITSALINHQETDVILADSYTKGMNGTVIKVDQASFVTKMYLKKDQTVSFNFSDALKTLNFYKLSQRFVDTFLRERLERHIDGADVNSYYEQIVKEAIDSGYLFYGLKPPKGRWWEIDTLEDLEIAEKMFA